MVAWLEANLASPHSGVFRWGRSALFAPIAICMITYAFVLPIIKLNLWFLLSYSGEKVALKYLWDDLFYYVIIARNIAAGVGPTFDGLGLTNGAHPLWTCLLAPFAVWIQNPDSLIIFVYLLSAVLWAASVLLLFAIAVRTRLVLYTLLALPYFVWYGAVVAGGEMFYKGMETGLLLMLILAFTYYAVSVDLFDITKVSRRQLLVAGGMLVLILLSRLDTILWVGALGLILLVRLWRQPSVTVPQAARYLVPLFAPTVLTAIAYLIASQILVGTPMPLSAQAKALGGPFFDTQIVGYALSLGFVSKMPVFTAGFVIVFGFAALAVLWTSGNSHSRRSPEDRPAAWAPTDATVAVFLGATLIALFLQVSYLYVMTSWEGEVHYFYLIPFLAMLAVPVLLRWVHQYIRIATRGLAWFAVVVAVAIGVMFFDVSTDRKIAEGRTHAYLEHSRVAAEWIKQYTPADSLYAMGDRAASFAFFLERPVYQLQGIVNTKEFLADRKAGRVNNEYLLARGIDYVVASAYQRSPIEDAGPGCFLLVEPYWGHGPKVRIKLCEADRIYHAELNDGPYSVWRLHPIAGKPPAPAMVRAMPSSGGG